MGPGIWSRSCCHTGLMDDAKPDTQRMPKHGKSNSATFCKNILGTWFAKHEVYKLSGPGAGKYMKYNVREYGGNSGFYCCNFSWFPQNEVKRAAVGTKSVQTVPWAPHLFLHSLHHNQEKDGTSNKLPSGVRRRHPHHPGQAGVRGIRRLYTQRMR